MSKRLGVVGDNLTDAIKAAIETAIPESHADVTGGGGHFSVVVVASAFDGLGMLARHRLVMGALSEIMAGDSSPVHAIDKLETRVP